jgi:hypothetical protein
MPEFDAFIFAGALKSLPNLKTPAAQFSNREGDVPAKHTYFMWNSTYEFDIKIKNTYDVGYLTHYIFPLEPSCETIPLHGQRDFGSAVFHKTDLFGTLI